MFIFHYQFNISAQVWTETIIIRKCWSPEGLNWANVAQNQMIINSVRVHATFKMDWIISAQDSGPKLPFSVNFLSPEDRNLTKPE